MKALTTAIILIAICFAACGPAREPFAAMCEAGLYMVEATVEGRSGVAAVFAGDSQAAEGFVAAGRDKLELARSLLDAVQDPDYRGDRTWRGRISASVSVGEALELLDVGDASGAIQRLDDAIGQLDAVSPPMPDTCIR